jgi:hypothetical protein
MINQEIEDLEETVVAFLRLLISDQKLKIYLV